MRIEVSGSTNGTTAWIPANSSGARLATAPMSRPPALPPSATSRSGAEAGVHQVPGAGDEVGEGRPLEQLLTLLVPEPAHLAAAPDVRHGVDHAAVESESRANGEARVDARLVGTVAVEQRRDPLPASTRAAVSADITSEIGTRVPSSAVAQSRRCT